MATNPNWPDVKVYVDFTAGPPNNVPGSNKVDINSGNTAVTGFQTKRGRQYELDTFQAGTATLTVNDPLEYLNPMNTSSPYNSGVNKIKPYRLVQIQATWSGTTYNVYTGYCERYPQTWEDRGYRGIKPLTAVDALSVISRTEIAQSYASEIANDSPVFTIPFDDQGAPARIYGLSVPTMSEFVINGGSVQHGGASVPDGSKAVQVTMQRQDPATVPYATQTAQIDMRIPGAPSEYSLNLGGASLEFMLKLDAGSVLISFASVTDGRFDLPVLTSNNFFCGIAAYGAGPHYAAVWDQNTLFSAGGNFFADSTWHHFVLTFSPNAGNPSNYDMNAYKDGVVLPGVANAGPIRSIGINSIMAQASCENGDYKTTVSVARFAAYNSVLSPTRIAAHANRALGYFGENADIRQARLLNQYWSSDTTKRTINGPIGGNYKTGMAADHSYNGRTLLDVLQEISLTDAGRIYADRSGVIVVEAKGTRDILNNASIATFGEQENPYDQISYDYDPTYVYSQSNLSSPSTADPVITTNPTAQADYGQRILSATLQTISAFRLIQAGIYFQFAYSNAQIRVEKMRIVPSENPALWPLALGLEISQRFTVKRRTSAGVTFSADHYVESISHTVTGETPEWVTEVEMSPVLVSRAGVIGDATYGLVGSTAVLVY